MGVNNPTPILADSNTFTNIADQLIRRYPGIGVTKLQILNTAANELSEKKKYWHYITRSRAPVLAKNSKYEGNPYLILTDLGLTEVCQEVGRRHVAKLNLEKIKADAFYTFHSLISAMISYEVTRLCHVDFDVTDEELGRAARIEADKWVQNFGKEFADRIELEGRQIIVHQIVDHSRQDVWNTLLDILRARGSDLPNKL